MNDNKKKKTFAEELKEKYVKQLTYEQAIRYIRKEIESVFINGYENEGFRIACRNISKPKVWRTTYSSAEVHIELPKSDEYDVEMLKKWFMENGFVWGEDNGQYGWRPKFD